MSDHPDYQPGMVWAEALEEAACICDRLARDVGRGGPWTCDSINGALRYGRQQYAEQCAAEIRRVKLAAPQIVRPNGVDDFDAETVLRDACIQASGALRLDAMLDEHGKPYGTTTEALAAIEAALALPPSLGPKGRWRDIASAPRDGTPILVARHMGPTWGWVRAVARWEGGSGSISGWLARGISNPPGELGLVAPQIWSPIPALPDFKIFG